MKTKPLTGAFVLRHQDGKLIAGFHSTHQVVQTAGNVRYAKLFATREQAVKWGQRYVNAGFGLTSFTVEESK